MNASTTAIEAALDTWWELHPVDASFAGVSKFDDRFPTVDAPAAGREREVYARAIAQLQSAPTSEDRLERLDRRMMLAAFAHASTEPAQRARFNNPAWYTGEIAFGIIALLLPAALPRDPQALMRRLHAVPDFLAAASAQLNGPVPRAWVERARAETFALERLLDEGFPRHPWAAELARAPLAAMHRALEGFRMLLASLTDGDPAVGRHHLAFVIERVHGIADRPDVIESRAERAFAQARETLETLAARRDPDRSWRVQHADLAAKPVEGDPAARYAAWHRRIMRDAATLVTPAHEYGLAFKPLPSWAEPVADALYFLQYRSPAAYAPGTGSTYWISAARPSELAVKFTHALHHASIGHHTQNARARVSRSRLGRIAGTDAASGLTMLGAGTLVEGWACYVERLMGEVPGFYLADDALHVAYGELRNIGCVLGDIRLHTGRWTLMDMQRFYRDEVGFASERIVAETTRNAMFPGSRLMYWLGTEAIAAARAQSSLAPRAFHDALLAYGALPVTWIVEELSR